MATEAISGVGNALCIPATVVAAPRREPPRTRAAEQRDELAPSDMDCHATPPYGGCVHAIEGRYHDLAKERTMRLALRRLLRSCHRWITSVALAPPATFPLGREAGES